MTELAAIAKTLPRFTAESETALSLYMPIDPQDRDVRAPRARLRNLMRRAGEVLEKRGVDETTRDGLLERLRSLTEAEDFERHRAPGLAAFVADGLNESIWLADTPPELVVAGRVLHLKPLLPALNANQRFHCLALSAEKARLFSGTAANWTERDLPLPTAETAAAEDSSSAAEDEESREALRLSLLTSDPHRVAEAVRISLANDPAVLVVAAEPNVAGNFPWRQLPHVHAEFLAVNPFGLDEAELRRQVVALLHPGETDVDQALDRVQARLDAGDPIASRRPEEILNAAYQGRVDTVLVAADDALWGQFAPGHLIRADGSQSSGDEDLLNRAAVVTLRTGGRAYAVPHGRLPQNGPLGTQAAALMRFMENR